VLGKFALGDAAPGHIAIDGKTLKGSRRHDAKPLHVLSAFATQLSTVVGDLVVEPDQNEITAALALLKSLPLDGAIITGDAIFCQRQICRHIRDARGHYVFAVKTNQPELHDAIAESLAIFPPCEDGGDPPRDLGAAETIEEAHGRIERRTCRASAEVVPHLAWPGAAQVVRIERTREIKGKATTEIAYYRHQITVDVFGTKFPIEAGFMYGLSRNGYGILGQAGFFDQVKAVTFERKKGVFEVVV
jgi:Transposase DDE domain